MAKEIILKFDLTTGETHIEANGFSGKSCSDATQFLKNSLGKVKDFTRKSEWYETNLEMTGNINSNLCG